MRVLTVQQPWAWAIFHGKDVENRTQLWKYRGPVAIHAGARISERGLDSGLVQAAHLRDKGTPAVITHDLDLGTILGVVDLVDAHHEQPAGHWRGKDMPACCESAWGEKGPKIVHLVLENPREFAEPIPNVKGKLGLWAPDEDLSYAIRHALMVAGAA